ncbi:helix-turn-helix domain-containing protein [Amycolatopsis anabasis]|uniref:helix-turn-helix domain-containing protein n=1 Tax=Amycolatopsis anabasis TaxID=1840409 RepID=UPI00131D4AE3|nr:helix-turn-helix transcriptional regulator [Amycolatopsis anabasis]
MTPPQAIGAVIGDNLRRLREQLQLTQEEVAQLARAHDPAWDRRKVEAIENGRRQGLRVEDLLVLATALNVALGEFAAGEGEVRLSEHRIVGRSLIRAILRGDHVRQDLSDLPSGAKRAELFRARDQIAAAEAALHPAPVDADLVLAARLGVAPQVVLDSAYALWDKTLTEERDARLGDREQPEAGDRKARRNKTTRELSALIEADLRERGIKFSSPGKGGKSTRKE